ncbi:MAG: ABC transporter substrate-binding protein [Clostridiales bacterium]|nr:ABC transporter substrate-binding protein [Clostridiales bacterium]
MATTKKLLSALLVLVMLCGMMSASLAETAAEGETPLVVGYSYFSQKFSPFFADTAYDVDVTAVVCGEALLTTDRQGAIVYNAIAGETRPYNGVDYTYTGPADVSVNYDEAANQTTYTIKIRDDLKFSDGKPVTADDLIFTYYVYLDPSYVGSTTLGSYNILGVKDYQTQTTSDIYAKYESLAGEILAAGAAHEWTEGDSWSKEQQDAYWALIDAAWADDCQDIVNYVVNNYNNADYAAGIGATPEEITADAGKQVAFGMMMWGFADFADGVLTGAKTGSTWNLAEGVYPTINDYVAEAKAGYNGDPDAFYGVEAADSSAPSTTATALLKFISEEGAKDEGMQGGIPNISGITKLDGQTVQVVTSGYEAPAVYSIAGITAAPLHYYGDPAQYDYENNKFGHPFGDLSIVQAKTTAPMGWGPYKFVNYENKVIYFEANEYFFRGVPKTRTMQWKEGADADKITGVVTGTIDITDPIFNNNGIAEIKAANSNGELSGDVVVVNTVDNLGYGYLGANADTVRVGDASDSQESKYLRTGLMTVFAVYRDVVIDSYYGERAAVINYPISNTSWAAPQPTDPDYKVAFSTDINGNPIYTAEMNADEKYAAALKACVEYLKAAGYTWDEATGKFTAAPEGASLEYEAIIPADGVGDHPAFGILTDAKAAFETIGITLTINDPSDSNVLWDKLDAGTQNFWAAAWQATIDPDMYQIYHSSNIVGLGGSDSNHYHIADADLDQLILDARQSDDQAFRKATYKAALDKIIEWAVELPTYQRQNCYIFSPARVNMDTVVQDITTFYDWLKEVETVEMK